MSFVGRLKETNQILEAIEKSRNVIITGKFGMGRTSIVRHVSDLIKAQWRFVFVDFSKTPGRVCKEILSELWPGGKRKSDERKRCYKSDRHQIADFHPEDGRQIVFVLDNIAALSRQKLIFLRYLVWERRFLFIAITESFLPERDFFLLRAELMPQCTVRLGRFSRKESIEFFQHAAERADLKWTELQLRNAAEITGGYPPHMQEMIKRVNNASVFSG